MSELNSESTPAPAGSARKWGGAVAIVAIIAAAVVILACIAGCVVISYAFMVNAPW